MRTIFRSRVPRPPAASGIDAKRTAAVLAGALAAAGAPALAQPYPVKPVRFIVPYVPGGSTDTLSRAVAQKMAEGLGQTVVVENRAGAGGLIGTEAMLKLPADGYTIALGTISTLAIIPLTQAKPAYDPQKDIAPVVLTSTGPYLMVAHPSLPARTIPEFVRLAQAKPAGVAYGSTGIATGTHLTAEYFASVAGIKMTHVPYKGDGAAVIDLLAGQIATGFFPTIVMTQHVKAGKLRGLAVTAQARLRELPAVPTMIESGYANFESGTWHGIVARAGTPPAVIQRLNAEAARAIADPAVRNTIEAQGITIGGGPPEAFEKYIAGEIAKWKRVIAGAGLKVE